MSDELNQDNAVPATEQKPPLAIKVDEVPANAQLFAAARIMDVLPAAAYERIGQMTLTPDQEAALDEDTPDDEIDIRPDGLIYCSHEYIRRRLNKALGRMGWTLVPGSPLTKQPNSSTYFQRWILFIGGVYCSEALSSREYYENNPQMSIDDVAESIKSDCLRRCAKDLGLATEPWNRRFAERWRREHAIEVLVSTNRGNQKQWRRKDGDPLRNEISAKSPSDSHEMRASAREPSREAPKTATTQQGSKAAPVNPPQRDPEQRKPSTTSDGGSQAAAAPSSELQPQPEPPKAPAPSPGRPSGSGKQIMAGQQRNLWQRIYRAGLLLGIEGDYSEHSRKIEALVNPAVVTDKNREALTADIATIDATNAIQFLVDNLDVAAADKAKTSAGNLQLMVKALDQNQMTRLVKKLDEAGKGVEI